MQRHIDNDSDQSLVAIVKVVGFQNTEPDIYVCMSNTTPSHCMCNKIINTSQRKFLDSPFFLLSTSFDAAWDMTILHLVSQ